MNWKDILKDNVNTVEQLKEFITMTPEEEKHYEAISSQFPISSTAYYLGLIDPSDPR